MPTVALIAAIFSPALVALVLLVLRRRSLRDEQDAAVSPVSRQHFELLQGGELSPKLIEATKRRFQALLERGDNAAVEARIRPGEQFVVQVRALAELGTDAAGQILERQLGRHLSDDRIEQTWYHIDLASGLRQLNRSESLPSLLRCVDFGADAPLGPVFAAETLCFDGFGGYLRQPKSKLGEAALRVTQRVLEGFRICLPPQVVVEGRLGEMIETIWDHRPGPAQATVVRVLHETLRYLRRVPATLIMLGDDPAERDAFLWQMGRLEAIEETVVEYLSDAANDLLAELPAARDAALRDILLALADLRVETSGVLLPLVERGDFAEMELALNALRWSLDPCVGLWMRQFGREKVDLESRTRRRRPIFFRRDPVPVRVPYAALLRALRGQMSAATEEFLLLAARDRDPQYRLAAISSLGWWEPAYDQEVIQCLEEGRRDVMSDVRRAARAALARLGERSALQWFRQALASEESQPQHEAIHFVASEGLTLLWPELDRLVESENFEIACHAREALAVMSEEMEFTR
jgi:hypothetical protein